MDIVDSSFLGKEPVGHLMIRLSLPAIVAQVINMLYNMVDRIYIGHSAEGTMALTGLGICFPVIALVMAFTGLVSNGSAPRASFYMGKKQDDVAENIMGNSFTSLLLSSIFLTVLLLLFTEPILRVFGASDLTMPYALRYMQIYSLGTVFVQVSMGMNNFITAQGFSKMSMYTIAIGAVLNIILDPIFIFGFSLGVGGAALATIVSQGVSALFVLYFLTGKRTHLHLRRAYFRLKPEIMLPCLALGLSSFIMMSTQSAMAAAFNVNLLKYGGNIAVGTFTILASVMGLVQFPLNGMRQGSQPVISYNYGANNLARLKRAISLIFISFLVYTITFFAFVELFPHLFVSIFTNDREFIEYCVPYLRIYAIASGIFGLQSAAQTCFIALGEAKVSISIALLRKVILLIPLIFILPHFFADPVLGIFFAEPISDCISVTYTLIVFRMVIVKVFKQMEATASLAD
jgi:putative MATE family efflux protein